MSPSGRKVVWLRGLVLATVALVVSWRLTVPLGLLAAFLAGLAGSLLADRLARAPAGPERQLRRSALFVLAALALFLGFRLARAAVSSELLASFLGPVPTLHLGEILLWGGLIFPIVFALRFAAARSGSLRSTKVQRMITPSAIYCGRFNIYSPNTHQRDGGMPSRAVIQTAMGLGER